MTVQLHYTVDGPPGAPLLVLGSSLGTTGALWQPQLPALSQMYQVVRYDHRGHGRSPVLPGPYRLEDLGGDVLALLDKLDAPTVHLGGLSLGGMTAMWVAAHAPARVDKLILMNTAAKLGPPEVWSERAAAVQSGGMAAVTDTVLSRWFSPAFATSNPGVVAWVRRLLSTCPPEGYAACCAAIETMDLLPDLAAIAAPTLVVAGGDDPATPPPLLEQIAKGIAGSRYEVVPGGYHLSNVEYPAAVSRLMLDFLA